MVKLLLVRLTVGQRILDPFIGVRIPAPQLEIEPKRYQTILAAIPLSKAIRRSKKVSSLFKRVCLRFIV